MAQRAPARAGLLLAVCGMLFLAVATRGDTAQRAVPHSNNPGRRQAAGAPGRGGPRPLPPVRAAVVAAGWPGAAVDGGSSQPVADGPRLGAAQRQHHSPTGLVAAASGGGGGGGGGGAVGVEPGGSGGNGGRVGVGGGKVGVGGGGGGGGSVELDHRRGALPAGAGPLERVAHHQLLHAAHRHAAAVREPAGRTYRRLAEDGGGCRRGGGGGGSNSGDRGSGRGAAGGSAEGAARGGRGAGDSAEPSRSSPDLGPSLTCGWERRSARPGAVVQVAPSNRSADEAAKVLESAPLASVLAPLEDFMGAKLSCVAPQESVKVELLEFEAGVSPRPARRAQAVLILPRMDLAVEALIELGRGDNVGGDRVVVWRELAGGQPMNTPNDSDRAGQIIRSYPALDLMRDRYGVTNRGLIVVDTCACHSAPEALNHRRLMQGFIYIKLSPNDNEYAHPLDVVPIADLNLGRVVHMDMYGRASPVPMECGNYHRDLQTQGWRTDLKPLNITQPQGARFTLDLKRQKWSMRIGINARDGLHQVDKGKLQPVLHRMSLVEMAVPYGDPGYPYIRKCAFDVGDCGFGFCANSVELRCDCLGAVQYLDGVVNNAKGEPVVIKKTICIHEEDHGLLWKHTDMRTGHVESRRSRRLVMQTIFTFHTYEYASSTLLYQDGTIEYELRLTGILSTSVAHPGEERPTFGVRVAPPVNGSVHQHFFCMRIDPAIDDPHGGRNLVISEVEAVALPLDPAIPAANAFIMQETDLLTTHAAKRNGNFSTARVWKIKNPSVLDPISKESVAYKLVLAPSPMLMAGPTSLVAQRAVFATQNLWVTIFAEDQRYPAGEHVVRSKKCLGLGEWTKQDDTIEYELPLRGILSASVAHLGEERSTFSVRVAPSVSGSGFPCSACAAECDYVPLQRLRRSVA